MALASPNTGKTHGRHCRILVDGTNLSGDARTLGNCGVEYDDADVTGWDDSVRQYLSGMGVVMFGPLQAVLDNSTFAAADYTDAGSHTELSSVEDYYASLFVGVRTAPVVGNDVFSARVEQLSYTTDIGDEAVLVNANFQAYGGTTPIYKDVWGKALAAGTKITASTDYDHIDSGASSSSGAIATLHLTAPSNVLTAEDWEILVEHSATGDFSGEEATLMTFTADGSALTAERQTSSGTVNRYVRATATKTTGAGIRPWIAFIRL